MSTSGDSTMGDQPATSTQPEPAFTVFSAYSGKVYACCVSVESRWAGHGTTPRAHTNYWSSSSVTPGDRIPTAEGSP